MAAMDGTTARREILCGVPIDLFPDSAAALAAIEGASAEAGAAGPLRVCFVNAHVVNTAASTPGLMEALSSGSLNLADGIGVWLGGRILFGTGPVNLNGTDFGVEALARGAARGLRFFFLGAAPGVAEKASERLRERIPGLKVAGTRDGFFDAAATDGVIRDIVGAGTDVLFVCMGVPRQELWIRENGARLTGVRAAFALGAFFDFHSGAIRRAPRWMIRARMEWVYRLCLEPGRLWRRYIVGNVAFMARVMARKLASGPDA